MNDKTSRPTYVDRLDLHEGPVETNHEPLNRKLSGKLHQTTQAPCRFRWNGADHTNCPRCGGTNIDPVPMLAWQRYATETIESNVKVRTGLDVGGASYQTTLAKLAEIDRVITAANNLLRLQSAKAVPCQWKIRAFLEGRKP